MIVSSKPSCWAPCRLQTFCSQEVTFTPESGEAASRPCSVTAEARGFAVRRQAGGVEQQVDWRERLVALPESHLVVDHVNARGALAHLVCADQFAQLDAHPLRVERKGHAGAGGVPLQPPPVPLEGERLALDDAQRREQSPAAEQARLSRREPHLLDRNEMPVVE